MPRVARGLWAHSERRTPTGTSHAAWKITTMQTLNLSDIASRVRALTRGWLFALGALIIASMFLIALGFISAPPVRASERSSQEAVRSFLEPPSEQFIARLEVYYVPLSMWTNPINEAALRHNSWTCKGVIKLPQIKDVREAFQRFKFKRVPRAHDFRLACVFYNECEKEVLTISFAGDEPVVSINGESFDASAELLVSALAFIPHEAHQYLLKEFTSRYINTTRHYLEELRSSPQKPVEEPESSSK